jgi:hypothetical protein
MNSMQNFRKEHKGALQRENSLSADKFSFAANLKLMESRNKLLKQFVLDLQVLLVQQALRTHRLSNICS